MDVFRIEGELIEGGGTAFGQSFELVAGFTPLSYIAGGNWFGAVKYFNEVYPFVLTDDGRCRYAGDHSQMRSFTIVKRPVKVGEVFELTWDDNNDCHCYRVSRVTRVNLHTDRPDDEPRDVRYTPPSALAADELPTPGIFIKSDVIRHAFRPEAFKATIVSLIDSGNAVAVGKDAIESVFTDAAAFSAWFEAL